MQIPAAQPVSALTGDGLEAAWTKISDLAEWRREQGWRTRRRREQDVRWMQEEIERRLTARFTADPAVAALTPGLRAAVAAGALSPEDAADRALTEFFDAIAAAKA